MYTDVNYLITTVLILSFTDEHGNHLYCGIPQRDEFMWLKVFWTFANVSSAQSDRSELATELAATLSIRGYTLSTRVDTVLNQLKQKEVST